MSHTCPCCGHHNHVIVAVNPQDLDGEKFEIVSDDRDFHSRRNEKYRHDNSSWKRHFRFGRWTQYRPVVM